MRILAGPCAGTLIKYPKTIRPTSAKVRAALFNIVGAAIEGARVADVCAGSGAVGLEAWSRGAARVTWVERDPACVRILRDNVRRSAAHATARTSHAILCEDAVRWITRAGRAGVSYDLIFFDPPYRDISLLKKALQRIGQTAILTRAGWLVIEHSHAHDIPQPTENIEVASSYRYGDTQLTFVRLRNERLP